jgi:hypothetical protein
MRLSLSLWEDEFMRNHWKLGIALLVIMSLSLVAQTVQQPIQPAAKPIAGAGCVEAGVETGCLLLKDAKTKTLYNLFFTGKDPTLGAAIQFTGVANVGVNACMQGKPVNVKEWKPIKMHCGAPAEGKK